LLGVLVGSVTAFAGTWWLQRSDEKAELRGAARVLAMDLDDRATTVEALGGVAIPRALSTNDVRWCVQTAADPMRRASSAVRVAVTGGDWQRRCAHYNPELAFNAQVKSLLRPDARGLSWTEADRKLLASRMTAQEWTDLVEAVTVWEGFRDSAGWFKSSGRFRTALVDRWFDDFGLYRRGGRAEVRDFRLAAQRAALALELGRRALSRHAQ
jgi:hypothetical protein